jgi:aspartyl/glutamyl-tRNA(Asn/Gln) amidotransferase C subunit
MKDEEFERLLKISRVRLTDDERRKIRKDIEEIISYFDKIQGVECHEAPAYQPIDVPARFRKDVVRKFENVKGLKKDAVLNEDYIRGPKL